MRTKLLLNATYFYPRPPRGGRRCASSWAFFSSIISIHALREEGDRSPADACHTMGNFYPRPPRGGRLPSAAATARAYTFLSTPSARRATISKRQEQDQTGISIHALREEGDSCYILEIKVLQNFYPRPPRGGRHAATLTLRAQIAFLSTPSARRATGTGHPCMAAAGISIHALREEGDSIQWAIAPVNGISIHALREEGDV